jgi:O-succinylbenzoate synthase
VIFDSAQSEAGSDHAPGCHRSLIGARHPVAKAGLENAVWDLLAGIPLSIMLGGQYDRVEVGVSIGPADLAEQLERVEQFIEQGYHRIKMKIEPGWAIRTSGAVRERHPTSSACADANSAFPLTIWLSFRKWTRSIY